MSGLAASRAGHKKGWEELGEGPEDIQREGLCGVALGEGEDSFEAIPEERECCLLVLNLVSSTLP